MKEPKYVDVNNLHLAFRRTIHGDYGDLFVPYKDVRKALERVKGEDVVPVVRCGNCRFYKTFSCAMDDPLSDPPKADSYCSYGEKED